MRSYLPRRSPLLNSILGVIAGTWVCVSADGAAVFDLSIDYEPSDFNIIGVRGTLTTDQFGTLTTEAEIEEFLNSWVDPGFIGVVNDIFAGNPENPFSIPMDGVWDLRLGGSSSATLISEPSGLRLDLNTPLGTEAQLFLESGAGSTFAIIQTFLDPGGGQTIIIADAQPYIAGREIPFDSELFFPVIPEPSAAALGLFALIGWIGIRRR